MKPGLVVPRALLVLPLAVLSAGCSNRDITVRVEDYDGKRDVCSSTVTFLARVEKDHASPSQDEAKPIASKLVPHERLPNRCTYRLAVPAVAKDEWLTLFVTEKDFVSGQKSWPRVMVDSVVQGSATSPETFTVVRRDRASR